MAALINNFDFSYCKRKNQKLFTSLENYELSKLQNFIPVYKKFFSLNESNFNNINLDQKYNLEDITEKQTENKYTCKIINKNNIIKKTSFFKFSPLLDPIKFMIGKYDMSKNLFELPKFNNNSFKKITDPDNAAYVDGFFSYLTSKLLNSYNFIHGTDFYGSFIAMKKNYHYNIFDDFDYLNESEFFHKNLDNLFKIEEGKREIFYGNSRNCQKKINISEDITDLQCETIDGDFFNDIFKKNNYIEQNIEKKIIFKSDVSKNNNIHKTPKTSHSSSTCSSRSSYTDDDSEEDESQCSESLSSTETENEVLNAIITEFPVNIICLEGLDDTLDSLLFGGKILTIPEWKSIIFQILIILTVYQKTFSFTHNDLHTNNIMYIKTDRQYIIYCINKKYYKIPTFGKIIKIIDFGRAIYKFRNKIICSDSFKIKGDAATQYNFGPCLNKNKPQLEPNFSFDLTRLACSLYDYFVPFSDEERKVKHPVGKLIIKWCKDDRGKNILYKKNGDERYPDFKLYKMIARNVHNHIPSEEIKNPIFNEFIIQRKKIKKKRIINIDNFVKFY